MSIQRHCVDTITTQHRELKHQSMILAQIICSNDPGSIPQKEEIEGSERGATVSLETDRDDKHEYQKVTLVAYESRTFYAPLEITKNRFSKTLKKKLSSRHRARQKWNTSLPHLLVINVEQCGYNSETSLKMCYSNNLLNYSKSI